jgi:S-DNA-T family DNA segregation ATPase FtsK/SpoIIIE
VPGGLIGDLVASLLVENFNIIGSTIILVTSFIIGITIWLKLSWVKIFEVIGKYFLLLLNKIFQYIKKLPSLMFRDKDSIDFQKDIDFKKKLEKLKRIDDVKIEPEVKVTNFSDRVEKEKQIPLFENNSSSKIPPLSLLNSP